MRKHKRIISRLDNQRRRADTAQVIATGGAAIVILGTQETVQRRGYPPVEVPERAHLFQGTKGLEGFEPILTTVLQELALLDADIRQHLAHEVLLIHPREPQPNAIRALIQAKRHRHRRRALQP